MRTAERRSQIMKILYRRRHETMRNLASEFGVSPRTIQRDIEALSELEPIYTQVGRYGGGVYIMKDYRIDRVYMTDTELHVLQKLYTATDKNRCFLTDSEKNVLGLLISKHSNQKPNT